MLRPLVPHRGESIFTLAHFLACLPEGPALRSERMAGRRLRPARPEVQAERTERLAEARRERAEDVLS